MPKYLSRAQVISHLLAFRHASRTNFEKRTLTNHDAIAYILWSLGTLTFREIQDIVAEWRFGTSARKRTKVHCWDSKKPVYRNYSPIGLGYLFNTCSSGGYSFVADRFDMRGHVMCASQGKYMYRAHIKESEIAKHNKKEAKEGEPGQRDCYFLRRTYWYRVGKGTYAPTVECAKRMAEMKHFFK